MGDIMTLYTEQFQSNLTMVAQQKESVFTPYVTVKTGLKGETAVAIESVGKTEVIKQNKRYRPTPLIEMDYKRRWYMHDTYDWGTAFDSLDAMQMIQDPTSQVYASAVAAFNRQKDDTIKDAIFGINKVGKDHEENEELPAENIIKIDAAFSGDEFKSLTSNLLSADIDLDSENFTAFLGPKQLEALFNDPEYITSYYGQTVLDQGKVKPFLGFGIKVVNNLPLVEDGGSWYRLCPVFTKDAVGLGIWEDFKSFAFIDNQRMQLPRLGATFTLGATRLDNEKIRVLKIKEA